MADLSTPLYPWLSAPWDKLTRLYQQQRLPHAVLLEGPVGIGKQALAQHFAQQLLCQQAQPQPCGQCKDCLLLAQNTHPDLVIIEPEEQGKQIKIQQVRDLADFIGSHSQQGGYRIIIIHPPEALNLAASNALLKGLEEPGDNTLFLLVSDRPGQLLPTIRSRCQSTVVAPPDRDQALQWLADHEVEDAQLLLNLAGGAPLLAKALAAGELLSQRATMLDTLKSVVGGQLSVPEAAQLWQKADLLMILSWLSSLINDMSRYQHLHSLELIHNRDAEKLITRAADRLEAAVLFAFSDKIQEYRRLLLAKHNPNPQLLCEDLLVSWFTLFRPSNA